MEPLLLVRLDRCLCPLCQAPRRSFYCSDCIRFGDFSHSNGPLRDDEILSEKRLKLKELSLRSSRLTQRISEHLEIRGREESIRIAENKRLAELRIRYLKEIIAEKRLKVANIKDISERICALNAKRKLRLPLFASRTKKMREYFQISVLKLNGRRTDLRDLQVSIAPLRIKHLKDLVDLIFPLEKIHRPVNKEESFEGDQEDEDDVVEVLAEAMRTSFVHGRWITANSEASDETAIRIVNPSLPSSYGASFYQSEDPVILSGPITPSSPPDASEINLLSGLSYLQQLLKLIAAFSDVILPQRSTLRDFFHSSGHSPRFARRLASLNLNVVYLLTAIDPDFPIEDPLQSLANIYEFMQNHIRGLPETKPYANAGLIRNPEALSAHTKRIFAGVEQVQRDIGPDGCSSSLDEAWEDSRDFGRFESDSDEEWISVSDLESASMPTPPGSLASNTSNIVSSFLRGFSGASGGA